MRPAEHATRAALAVAVALAGAGLAVLAHLPLPWFTGPVLAVGLANMLGAGLLAPPHARDGGQWIIGTALGLYFTPAVVQEIVRLAPWVAVNLLFCVLLGAAGGALLRRATGESATTSFFAMAIGGAGEMAAQAERLGGRVDRVAAAHSLRILMVALTVPTALALLGAQGADPYEPISVEVDWRGLAVLAALTGGGAIVLLRLGAPNVFMLGPLIVAAALTGSGLALTALPPWLANAGQLLIGVALGSRFTREFFTAAPRFLGAVAAITVGYLLAAAAFGAWLAGWAGLPVATAVLATTPGGIGEMAITAKVLKLGAPVVAAFHGMRMALIVLLVGPLYRALHARDAAARDDLR